MVCERRWNGCVELALEQEELGGHVENTDAVPAAAV